MFGCLSIGEGPLGNIVVHRHTSSRTNTHAAWWGGGGGGRRDRRPISREGRGRVAENKNGLVLLLMAELFRGGSRVSERIVEEGGGGVGGGGGGSKAVFVVACTACSKVCKPTG